MPQRFYVLLGDVVASRKIENRPEFQKTIEEACREINEQFENSLYTDFKTTKGLDEIGGVLTDISDIFRIITSILDHIYPNLIRFVLACGYVDTGLETKDVTKMDGPVFHKAASDIMTLKETGLLFKCSVDDIILDSAIEGEINLILMIKNKWKPKQYQIVRDYNRSKNQSNVAKELRVSQSLIWRTLKHLNWRELNYIEKNLNYALHSYHQKLSGCQDIERNSNNRNTGIGVCHK
jgi:hypothetical protein